MNTSTINTSTQQGNSVVDLRNPDPRAAVTIKDLVVEYGNASYPVRPLDGFSASVNAGSLVLLLGPSGCGKTTLLSCLGGILAPTSGTIDVGGTQVHQLSGAALTEYRRNQVGIVFQAFNLVPSLDATENVMAPMRAAGVKSKEARKRAVELLERVDLGHRLTHKPSLMSGGQQQRVAIARALALDPKVILADEPTAHLDYVQVEGVLRLVRSLADSGRTIIVSTHDDRMLALADTVIEMQPRAAVDHGDADDIIEEYKAGETIFTQGSMGSRIDIVESGKVQIFRELVGGGRELLAERGPGDFFGEMGPLFHLPRSATAIAQTDTVLRSCTVKNFRQQIGDGTLPQVIAGTAQARIAAH
jgi:putative ABC transport system ATP-binding protein